MSKRKQWVITLNDAAGVADAKRAIADAGFEIDTSLDEIGVITGAGDDDVAEQLRGLSGVADVAEDAPIDIGPPDAPIS